MKEKVAIDYMYIYIFHIYTYNQWPLWFCKEASFWCVFCGVLYLHDFYIMYLGTPKRLFAYLSFFLNNHNSKLQLHIINILFYLSTDPLRCTDGTTECCATIYDMYHLMIIHLLMAAHEWEILMDFICLVKGKQLLRSLFYCSSHYHCFFPFSKGADHVLSRGKKKASGWQSWKSIRLMKLEEKESVQMVSHKDLTPRYH